KLGRYRKRHENNPKGNTKSGCTKGCGKQILLKKRIRVPSLPTCSFHGFPELAGFAESIKLAAEANFLRAWTETGAESFWHKGKPRKKVLGMCVLWGKIFESISCCARMLDGFKIIVANLCGAESGAGTMQVLPVGRPRAQRGKF
ncbi:hypothetical protein PIB30_099378, partial [Stylosanthes scabra]|nr:hypothetical protein [Stylosanthes scabra]